MSDSKVPTSRYVQVRDELAAFKAKVGLPTGRVTAAQVAKLTEEEQACYQKLKKQYMAAFKKADWSMGGAE